MILNNFKIRKIDEYNITYSEYRKVKDTMKWIESGKYYSTLGECLNSIRNHIINSYTNLDDYEEVLNKIKELNVAIYEENPINNSI